MLPKILELKNINFKRDDKKILSNINLTIFDKPAIGQFIVLLGTSGCGKSTLLRIIAGLLNPDSGEILINEQPRKSKINMVSQRYASLPWRTVYENIKMGVEFKNKKDYHDDIINMIDSVGLNGMKHRFVDDKYMSGGQQQRVAIARALISKPDIVLMDEPFGALDTITRNNMHKLLIDLWEKTSCTIIFVTHSIEEAVYLGDEIYMMKEGEIVNNHTITLPYKRPPEIKNTAAFYENVRILESFFN